MRHVSPRAKKIVRLAVALTWALASLVLFARDCIHHQADKWVPILVVSVGMAVVLVVVPKLNAHIKEKRRAVMETKPCPTCGYSLIGDTTGVCPECGKRFIWSSRWAYRLVS
jgi:predicted RNA-binding Zn-ribbon protein involved in translation (DUF1610 family)